MLTFHLNLDVPKGQRSTIVMTYFHYKVRVKGYDLGHYPAKLLKHFRFSQNVFTFLKAKEIIFKSSRSPSYFCHQIHHPWTKRMSNPLRLMNRCVVLFKRFLPILMYELNKESTMDC